MKKFLCLLLCFCFLVTVSPVSVASTQEQQHSPSEYVAGEMLIMQKERNAKPLPLKSAEVLDCSALDTCSGEEIKMIKGTVAYGADIEKICDNLEKRSDIISADPNYISTIGEISLPEEAQRNGYDYNAFNWYKNSLKLCEAWQSADTLGSEDVIVGVIDTGVNVNHLELKDNMWCDAEGHNGYNAVNDNYDITDNNSHGSNVAGIIGMQSNSFGYAGISPKVKIMGLKAASSTSFTDSAIIECLNFALENGANIINMSYSGPNLSDTMAYAYQAAARKAVLVAAAGNSSLDCAENPQYPAACAGVIGVMAYGSFGNSDRTNYNIDNSTLCDFSNYDNTGLYYQIAAPGVDIEGAHNKSDDEFTLKSGTSQATPIVAGTAALYLSLYPQANPYQVRQAIIQSAAKEINGYFDDTSHKKINIGAALACAPCEDKEINLSDGAKRIMSAAFGEQITNPHISDLDSLGFITPSAIENKADLSALGELTGLEHLKLNNMNLAQNDLDFLKSADFYRLSKIDLSSNSALEDITFSDKTPVLRQVNVSDCSLSCAESFIALQGLNELTANNNRFVSTAPLKDIPGLKVLEMANCALQDCVGLKQPNNIVSADISGNYISDASALLNYNGAYLDISYNPLSLSDNKNYCLKSIKEFMNDNYYSYHSIKLIKDCLNGDSQKEYIKAKSIALEQKQVPRTAQNLTLKTAVVPENANVSTFALFGCEDERVKLNTYTGVMTWRAEDFNESETLKIAVSPTSAFPQFNSALQIMAPEVLEFKYENSTFTLKANLATDYIKIGNTQINSYTEENGVRSFNIPASVNFSENLVAVPFDSVGAGSKKSINAQTSEREGKAEILKFYSDKSSYSTSESASVYVLANNFTSSLKIKDCVNKTEFIIDCFEQTRQGRLFNFKTDITTKKDRRYKAYASSDGSFSIGAKVLTFTVEQTPSNLKLSLGERPALYFSEGYESADIESTFYPAYCDEKIECTSSNPESVSVNEHLKVEAQSYGASIIEARSESGLKYSLPVIVSSPEMDNVETTIAKSGETSTFDFYTYAASDIVIKNKDGSDVDFAYSVKKSDSNMDGFDAHYTLSAIINDSLEHNIRIYAVDKNGVNAYTHFRDVRFTCPAAVEDFSVISEKENYNRNDGTITLRTRFFPENSRQSVRWSLSSNAIASLKGYSDYALITPKGSGSVTVYATADGITKQKTLSFYSGKIISAQSDKTEVNLFEPFNISVTTTKDVKYIFVEDEAGLNYAEYNCADYCTLSGDYKQWALPFSFEAQSDKIEISCGDSISNCEGSVWLEVEANPPQEDKLAAMPSYIYANEGDERSIDVFSALSMDPRAAEFISEDESIASVENGYVKLLSAGSTNIICTYQGERLNIPVKVFAPIKTLTFSQKSYTLNVGEEISVKAQTEPLNPTEIVNYRSDNEEIFKVENGEITALKVGSANLIAESESGISVTAEIKVKSAEQINEMNFEYEQYFLEVGESLTPKLLTNIADYTNKVKFVSSNKRILDFEGDTFKALQEGTVSISAISDSGTVCSATVKISAERQMMLNRNYLNLPLHSLSDISLLCLPEGIDADGYWLSDNIQIAVVAQDGSVYAKKCGFCNIYYVSQTGEVDSCTLKVNSVSIRSFSLDTTSVELEVGENHIIGYSLSNDYADETPSFSSSNEKVAAVDENGIISAIGEGTALIRISAKNGTAYSMIVSVSAAKYTLSGKSQCGATAVISDLCGNEKTQEVSGEFEIENLSHNTYSLNLSALHHTSVTIEDIDLCENVNAGDIYLPNGDANADGIIDLSDISSLLQSGVYASAALNANYDINDDAFIDINDISEILLKKNYGEQNKTIIY